MNESAAHDRPMATSKEERTWSMIAHLGAPAGLLLSAGLFGFAVPLIVWLAKRDESEFVSDQAGEALNFQLTLLLVHFIGVLFVFFTIGIGALGFLPPPRPQTFARRARPGHRRREVGHLPSSGSRHSVAR